MTLTKRVLPKGARLVPTEAKRVFKGEIFEVFQWPQKLFDGSTATFEMLRRPDTVCILATSEDHKIVACDERQPGGIVRKNHLPVGRVDPEDESVLAAAKRELVEETGMEFSRWDLIEIVQPDAKIEWFVYTFLARGLVRKSAPHLDPGEEIEVKMLPYEAIWGQASKYCDAIRKSKTLAELCERADKGLLDVEIND